MGLYPAAVARLVVAAAFCFTEQSNKYFSVYCMKLNTFAVMKKGFSLFVIVFLGLCSSVKAQRDSTFSQPAMIFMAMPDSNLFTKVQEGEINIHVDERVDALVEKYARLSEEKDIPIYGYRVQLASSSGNNAKNTVNQVKRDFLINFPDTPAYLVWEAPNYKIRVGDFRTKLDAERFMRKISSLFPYAFLVKDEINFPVLMKEEE